MTEHQSKHKLRLSSKLGSGAFGLVHKGVYDGSEVAVKTLSAKHAGCRDAQRMFFKEAKVLQEISHPNVVGFKALCKLPGQEKGGDAGWALVLELLKEGTLHQKILKQMTTPQSRVYTYLTATLWALDVALGLEHLHLLDPTIIHRDVKCANILLGTGPQGRPVAKISDFGLHVTAQTADRHPMFRVSADVASQSMDGLPFVPLPTAEPAREPLQSIRSGIPMRHEQEEVQEQQQEEHSSRVQQGDGSSRVQQADGSSRVEQDERSSRVQQGDGSSRVQQGRLGPERSAVGMRASERLAGAVVGDSANSYHESERRRSCEGALPNSEKDGQGYYAEFHGGGKLLKSSDNTLLPPPPNSSSSGSCNVDNLRVSEGMASFTAGGIGRRRPPPRRNPSFKKRAPHHTSPYACVGSGGSFTAVRSTALEGSVEWGSVTGLEEDDDWVEDGSVCSIHSSMCTTASLSEGGSIVGDMEVVDEDEVEMVFMLTGETGSCLYMAPEVYVRQPYNEKADVFSFGVVLYELFARNMLLFSEMPVNTVDAEAPSRYARKVADGYRPARPKKNFPDPIWDLVVSCWAADPVARPHMSEVVEALEGYIKVLQAPKTKGGAVGGPRSTRRSFSFGRSDPGVFASAKPAGPTPTPAAAGATGLMEPTAAAPAAAGGGDSIAAAAGGGRAAVETTTAAVGAAAIGTEGRQTRTGSLDCKSSPAQDLNPAAAAAGVAGRGGGEGPLHGGRGTVVGGGGKDADVVPQPGCSCVIC